MRARDRCDYPAASRRVVPLAIDDSEQRNLVTQACAAVLTHELYSPDASSLRRFREATDVAAQLKYKREPTVLHIGCGIARVMLAALARACDE
jgi:hypothetical protein